MEFNYVATNASAEYEILDLLIANPIGNRIKAMKLIKNTYVCSVPEARDFVDWLLGK